MADYFSFEDVMHELELSEEDLKRMVSEGELRAFRDENKMKFKKEDVENLKKGRITEPTIILPSTPGAQQDETVLDLDIREEQAALAGSAEDTAPPSNETDDLLLAPTTEEEKVGTEGEETFIEEDSDTGLTTEPLKLADEVESAETVETESVAEEEPVVEERPRSRRRTRRGAPAAVGAVEGAYEGPKASPLYTAMIIVAFVFAAYALYFGYDTVMVTSGRHEKPSGLTAGLASFMLDRFWGDKDWKKYHEREYPQGVSLPFRPNETFPEPTEGWYDRPTFQRPPVTFK